MQGGGGRGVLEGGQPLLALLNRPLLRGQHPLLDEQPADQKEGGEADGGGEEGGEEPEQELSNNVLDL